MKKYALVTGASRGIGRAIATRLAADGYHLYLTSLRSSAELSALKKEIETDYAVTCEAFTVDMGNPDDVTKLFSSIQDLDVLINNAGISHIGLLSETSIEQWHNVINTNLSSIFYTSRLAIPFMLKKKSGKIINISSVWGSAGASMEVAYSTSKGGMNSFTKALAKELAPSNIQVNAIACGLIDTQMNQEFSREELDSIINDIPSDRIGTPDEVASMVKQLLLCPDYLTGQIISLDGGWI